MVQYFLKIAYEGLNMDSINSKATTRKSVVEMKWKAKNNQKEVREGRKVEEQTNEKSRKQMAMR